MVSPSKVWCDEFPKLVLKSSELVPICVMMGESTQIASDLNHLKSCKSVTLHLVSEEGFCSDCNPPSVTCIGHEAKGTSRGMESLPRLPWDTDGNVCSSKMGSSSHTVLCGLHLLVSAFVNVGKNDTEHLFSAHQITLPSVIRVVNEKLVQWDCSAQLCCDD